MVGPAFQPICSLIRWIKGGSAGLAQATLERPPPPRLLDILPEKVTADGSGEGFSKFRLGLALDHLLD